MTSRKDGNRRLRQAAKILRKVAPNKFNMESITHTCGTPACVLGHYAANSKTPFSLQDRQLVLGEIDIGYNYDHPAIQDHFDLTPKQCAELFDVTGCGNAILPSEAADYIEDFVKARAKEEAALTDELHKELSDDS